MLSLYSFRLPSVLFAVLSRASVGVSLTVHYVAAPEVLRHLCLADIIEVVLSLFISPVVHHLTNKLTLAWVCTTSLIILVVLHELHTDTRAQHYSLHAVVESRPIRLVKSSHATTN